MQQVHIKTEKGDRCPICKYTIVGENCWVRFHIKYKPNILILACKYCNYGEYLLRVGHTGFISPEIAKRSESICTFMARFGVQL